MVLPRLRRALLLAMVLGAFGALFAGTPSSKDAVPRQIQLETAAASFGWSAEPSLHQDATDLDADGDLHIAGEGITVYAAPPTRDAADAPTTLKIRPYRSPCGFPSVSRPPPLSATLV